MFERVFRDAGLPGAVQTDNGPPFVAPRGLLGLTDLGVGWIQLGIRPVRIEPGHPEQNGTHERMPRTLEAETTQPPSGNRGAPRHQGIALEETDHEVGSLWFYDVFLGRYHQRKREVHVG